MYPNGGVLWDDVRTPLSGFRIRTAGIFKQYHAPADWMETVNTIGLEYYARMDEKPKGRGFDLEVQSNPLTLCTYPEALVELTFKAA